MQVCSFSTSQLLLPKLIFLEGTGFLYHHPRAQEPFGELELEQIYWFSYRRSWKERECGTVASYIPSLGQTWQSLWLRMGVA